MSVFPSLTVNLITIQQKYTILYFYTRFSRFFFLEKIDAEMFLSADNY